MLYILYSNDYEFFLGGNYRPEHEVLIAPTERILQTCDEIGVPMTLFADVACFWRYRQTGHEEVVRQVETQLRQAVRCGHDVQTHLHPHWFSTDITSDGSAGRRYRFEPSRFLLGNCASEEDGRLREFCIQQLSRARDYLTDLLTPIDPGYRCVAFRAGGYGIQPATETILAALEQTGYRIDSSVVPGMRMDSNVNRIDFTLAPRLGNYRISAESGIWQPASQGLFEIPVAAGQVSRRQRLREYLGRRNRRLEPPSGYGIQEVARSSQERVLAFFRRFRRRVHDLCRGWTMLELCDDVDLMLELTHRYINKHRHSVTDLYFSLSCHSKITTPSQLSALRSYHGELERRYGGDLRAIRYQDACRLLDGAGRQRGTDRSRSQRVLDVYPQSNRSQGVGGSIPV